MSIGTPDFQKSVVSAQKEVLSTTLTGGTANFGVPPNAESIIVFASGPSGVVNWTLTGLTTGTVYRGSKLADHFNSMQGVTIFDAAPAIDPTMQIQGGSNVAPTTFIVYTDAAAHIVADASKLTDVYQQQYVVPSLPSTAPGDVPPVQLAIASASFSANNTLLGFPGANWYYRIFAAAMNTVTSGLWGALNDQGGGNAILSCSGPGNAVLSLPATGHPMAVNSPLNYAIGAGAGAMQMTVYYTLNHV